MSPLKQLIKENKATLTVYYPDCTRSRLWGNLDAMIIESGFQMGYRQWISHDYNSLNRFYADGNENPAQDETAKEEILKRINEIPVESLLHGHMFTKMAISGPSLLTIWHGENAIDTLLKLKGKTHPAASGSGTLRGSFWIDNPICNLCHSSDDDSAVVREIIAVGLEDLLDSSPENGQKLNPLAPGNYYAHCGIAIVCDVLNRILATMPEMEQIPYELPSSGDSRETVQMLATVLKTAQATLAAHSLSDFIRAFLTGDIKTVSDRMKQMPVTDWEYFVIQCSTLFLDEWSL